MKFMIYSNDKASSLSIRKANRDAHLTWLKTDTAAQVLMAGPWLNEDGDMAGSLLVVECESRDILNDWMARDPYMLAGLPETAIVKPFIWAVNPPL